MELDDIITCDDNTIRQLLETEEWAFDAEGLIPHCLSILKANFFFFDIFTFSFITAYNIENMLITDV